jgi:hypothetical protein
MPLRTRQRAAHQSIAIGGSSLGHFHRHVKEESVKTVIGGEFRVKGGDENVALSSGDDSAIGQSGEYFNGGANLDDPGRADENGVVRTAFNTCNVEVGFEGVDLPSEAVALNHSSHDAKGHRAVLLQAGREQDKARACAPHGST